MLSVLKAAMSAVFTLIFAFLLAGCLEGGLLDFQSSSVIFVSNNTSETLYFELSTADQESAVSVVNTEIPALSTVTVASIKRDLSLENGESLSFSFTLSNGLGEEVTLNQVVDQGLLSESISYGFTDQDQSPLQDDTDVRNYLSSFNQADRELTQIGMSSKNKARFKDIYYAVSNGAEMPEVPLSANELSIVTYNVWGLPVIAADIATRFKLIPEYIRSYDVIFIQEAFDSNRSLILSRLADTHPYQSNVLDGPGSNLYNGGVLILSRYPIVKEEQFIYPDCSGSDCFADKGVLYTEIIKGSNSYHLLATHTASFNSDDDRANRRLQFQQMRQLVIDQNIPADEIVIYGGDLNVDKFTFPGDYADMLNYLQVYEPNYSGYTKSTFDPDINMHARDLASGSDYPEYLDYILQSHEYGAQLDNTNDVYIPRNSHPDLWQVWDLSDHFPVRAHLK